MSGHTPGPWKWGKDWTKKAFGNPDNECSGEKYADLRLMAGDVEVIPIRIDHYEVMIDHDGTPEGTIRKADRRLIAAAPDLLEACKLALTFKREGCPDPSCHVCKQNAAEMDQLRAAIAKAETA